MCEYEISIEECVWDFNVLHWAAEGMSLTAFYHDLDHVQREDLENFSMMLDRVYRNLKKAMEREDEARSKRRVSDGVDKQSPEGHCSGMA